MRIELINKNCEPVRSFYDDAGLDCYVNIDESIGIMPNQTEVIPLGFKIEIPFGYAGIVKARSSVFKCDVNIDGVIDSGYRGEVCVMVQNNGTKPFIV